MKKITTLLLALFLSLLLITNQTYAAQSTEGFEFIQAEGAEVGYYYREGLTFDVYEPDRYFEPGVRPPEEQSFIINTGNQNTMHYLYNNSWVDMKSTSIKLIVSAENWNTDIDNPGSFRLYYVAIDTEGLEIGERNLAENIKPVGNNIGTTFRYQHYYDPEDYVAIDELPNTANDELAAVYFDVQGKSVRTIIRYRSGEVYTTLSNFHHDTDMSIFETKEAYLQNINSRPQIIINHSDRLYLRDILEAPDNEKPAFVPHSIWDLKTNEIVTQNTYTTNVYIKQNDAGVMISYIYIDEYIIDAILSTTLQWTSRTRSNILWGLISTGKTEWESHQATFTSDDYIRYKNLTSSWQNYVPGWNQIRNIYQNIKTFEMPRISSVNLSNPQEYYNVTQAEVERYFRSSNPEFDELNTNPRYKLWAFALEEESIQEVNLWLGSGIINSYTEFYDNPTDPTDPDNFQIIKINYQTNGKLYDAVGNDMNLSITIAPPLKATPDISRLNIVIFLAIVLIWVYVLATNKGFSSFRNLVKVSFIFWIVVALILVAYNYLLPEITLTILRL